MAKWLIEKPSMGYKANVTCLLRSVWEIHLCLMQLEPSGFNCIRHSCSSILTLEAWHAYVRITTALVYTFLLSGIYVTTTTFKQMTVIHKCKENTCNTQASPPPQQKSSRAIVRVTELTVAIGIKVLWVGWLCSNDSKQDGELRALRTCTSLNEAILPFQRERWLSCIASSTSWQRMDVKQTAENKVQWAAVGVLWESYMLGRRLVQIVVGKRCVRFC